MSNRFAPLGHLRCVLAVVIVIVLLIPATAQTQGAAANASSCKQSQTLSACVEFAGLHRAQKILGHKDRWARQLSDFDMGASQKTAEPTNLKEFLDFAADAGRGWTALEESNWKAVVDKLSDAMKGLNLRLPNIELVKTSGEEEFGAAYTRRNAIMFPESMTSLPTTDPRRAYFLLAHEVFHVLSRSGFSVSGMTSMRFLGSRPWTDSNIPAELEERRVSNPDAFEYLHALTVQSGSESVDVMPVIQSLLPLNEVIQLPNFFDALDIVLLSVDAGTGEALPGRQWRPDQVQLRQHELDPADAAQLLVHHPP